ncbi:MAG: glycosyltransferase family 2 protein [Clostridia bacterium]|nr:glycosyltransferase family 2 protein [Clostridia bacterium]
MKGSPIYSIVVPVYNEEQVILETYRQLKQTMDSTGMEYEIIFVNDGSRDKTLYILKELSTTDSKIKVISLSRNFGHQIAITAGIEHARGDATIIIDADLQDPPAVIIKMIKKWEEGYEVVYAKRITRKGETFFKRATAKMFYRILNRLTSIDIPMDTGDFRLMDRKVCAALKRIPERNRYIRGLVSWVGYKQTSIEYEREERHAGQTKYPLMKMLKLAADAITSFSYKPLKIATIIGFLISFTSFIYLIYALYIKLFTSKTVPGWTSIVTLNLLFNGIILIILGIIGEYIGKIYDEAKGRPLYLVSEKLGYEAEIKKKPRIYTKTVTF